MKEKFSIITTSNLFFIIISSQFFSCKNENEVYKTRWAEGICYPSNYEIGKGEIEFFSNSKGNLNFPTSMANSNWATTGQVRWFDDTDLPDSIFVSYEALNNKYQTYFYQGGIKLPKDKIIKLFKGQYGKIPQYINCGLAPGGRICVFIDNIELIRFKIKEVKKMSDKPLLSSDSINNLEYLKSQSINYSNWDKSDNRYELDFGFCSENKEYKLYHSYFITKEGLSYPVFKNHFENTEFGITYGKKSSNDLEFGYIQPNEKPNHRLQLPVHCKIEWKSKIKKELYYSTDVVLPKDFSKRFTKSYINPKTGKKSNYNRLIFGVEKNGQHCIIWLDGPEKQEKIMRFKAKKGIMNHVGLNSGGYASEIIYF